LNYLLRSCFFPLIQTRFRKTLEPSINEVPDGPRRKGLRAVGSLVIGFSGGTSSITLLDLVAKTYFAPRTTGNGKAEAGLKGGKDHPRNAEKGVWKGNPAVCYVEVCGAFPGVCRLPPRYTRWLLINLNPGEEQNRGNWRDCQLRREAF